MKSITAGKCRRCNWLTCPSWIMICTLHWIRFKHWSPLILHLIEVNSNLILIIFEYIFLVVTYCFHKIFVIGISKKYSCCHSFDYFAIIYISYKSRELIPFIRGIHCVKWVFGSSFSTSIFCNWLSQIFFCVVWVNCCNINCRYSTTVIAKCVKPMPVNNFRVTIHIQASHISVAGADIIIIWELDTAHRLYSLQQIRIISVLFDKFFFIWRIYSSIGGVVIKYNRCHICNWKQHLYFLWHRTQFNKWCSQWSGDSIEIVK